MNEYLTNTAAVYKFMHDQTLLYINQGYTATEIADMIQLPEALEKVWYTRQYYGTLRTTFAPSIKSTWDGTMQIPCT